MTYPSSLDELTDGVPADNIAATTAMDNATFPHDDHHRALATAVESIEGELGTDPSGSEATVKARIAATETVANAAAAKASNLSDLASASSARTNLGLGGAAVLSVGTTAGTVAAGDDSRITGALSAATAASTYQPLDSDLTAIAALSTTAYGRALLALADSAALAAALGSATTSASGLVELATSAETITGTDTVRAVTPEAAAAAYRPATRVPGSTEYGVPGAIVTNYNSQTGTLGRNQLWFEPMLVTRAITLTKVARRNISAISTSDTNVRVGLYAVNSTSSPTGNPLFEEVLAFPNGTSGGTTVGNVINVSLNPGLYYTAWVYTGNADNSWHAFVSQGLIDATIGIPNSGSPAQVSGYVSFTYGTLPTGLPASPVFPTSRGYSFNSVFYQWTVT